MILEILKYPDSRLGRKSAVVEKITPELRKLAQDMIETMYHAEGVGLAAPQVGVHQRLIVMDPGWHDGAKQPRVVINPQLELLGESITSENEGCLSVPLQFRADVPRSSQVRLTALDIDGNQIEEILDGMPAIVIQHENDHLEGTLFIDKISRLKRTIYDGKVKKWQKAQE